MIDDARSLIDGVKSVFLANVPPEQVLRSEIAALEWHPCVEEFANLIRGRIWPEVPLQVLDDHESCFHQLSKAAMIYYFPAYLILAIRNPLEAVAQTVKSYLTEPNDPPNGVRADFWLFVLDDLTPDQKDVIRRVLGWLDSKIDWDDDGRWSADRHELDRRMKFWDYALPHMKKHE